MISTADPFIMTHDADGARQGAMTTRANRLTPRATTDASAAGLSAPQLPAAQLRAFADALDCLGYDVESLLARAGLRRSNLDDPDGMIPCEAIPQVIGAACMEGRHPNLGAHLASVTPIGAFPLLDYLVVTADTVAHALDQLVRYFHVTDAPVTCAIVHDGDCARLLVQPGSDSFIAQYETSLIVHHMRAETENRIRIACVNLMTEPDDRGDLERLLGCSVVAPSTWTGVEIRHDMLAIPLRRRDAALRRVLEGHAAGFAARASRDDHDSAVNRVRALLASQLRLGVPPIRLIAKQLAIAPRTLQRRLAAEGGSYEQVVDVVRREAAERLLADSSLAIGEIGYLLGFSEPSAFHRAFKRWHRVPPREYRTTSGAAK
jgi:AraC-like DNA-binding protein